MKAPPRLRGPGGRECSEHRPGSQNVQNSSKAFPQKPLDPKAGFVAAVPDKPKPITGEAEANQREPRYWRGKPYPGAATWERHIWVRGQDLKLARKAVLRALVDHHWAAGRVNPGIGRIAEEVGMSRRAVTSAITWLEDNDWIEAVDVFDEDGRQTSNGYEFLDPPPPCRIFMGGVKEVHGEGEGGAHKEIRESRQAARAARRGSRWSKSSEDKDCEDKAGPDLCEGEPCEFATFTEPGDSCPRCQWRRPPATTTTRRRRR